MSKYLVAFIIVVPLLGCVSKTTQQPASIPHLEKSNIAEICFNGQVPSQKSSPELKFLLVQTQKLFATTELRKANPQDFVSALDKIIAQTEFKYLLDCKAKWEKPKNQIFRVSFPESLKNMELASSEEKDVHGKTLHVLEVHMWLEASVQQILPTYMHELLHVCQHEEAMEVWNKSNFAYTQLTPREKWTVAKRTWKDQTGVPPDFKVAETKAVAETEELFRAVNRNGTLNEIAAMNLMRNAFEHFVQIDPRYCEEDSVPENRKKNLALVYATSSDEVKSGIFAQRVLNWYKSTEVDGLIQKNTAEVAYPASHNGPAFKMKRLDPIFKKQIQTQGIPVYEEALLN